MFNFLKYFAQYIDGFSLDMLIGRQLSIFHTKEAEHIETIVKSLEEPFHIPLQTDNKYFSLMISPIQDIEKKHIGYVTEWCDITSEVKMEKEFGSVLDAMTQGDFSKRLELSDDGSVINKIRLSDSQSLSGFCYQHALVSAFHGCRFEVLIKTTSRCSVIKRNT